MTTALIFPGQGSQNVGMMAQYISDEAVVATTFTEASDVLGYDLQKLVLEGPEEQLNQTEYTQPALLCASVAVYRALTQNSDLSFSYMAGHSLGEYSALVCAGALPFTDALQLVKTRGQLMQSAVAPGEGSMAAILGIDDEVVIALCEDVSTESATVSAANFNSPGQIVVAGHTDAVEKLVAAAKEAGARRSVILPVSVPSHCVLMRSAADKLAEYMQSLNISSPATPVLHNVNAAVENDADSIRILLSKQLYQPVQWTKTVETLAQNGVTELLECGPGKVLSGLVKRINRQLTTMPLQEPADMQKALASIAGDS